MTWEKVQLFSLVISTFYCQKDDSVIQRDRWNFNVKAASTCSSTFVFERHAHISTSNQQLIHRTKSLPRGGSTAGDLEFAHPVRSREMDYYYSFLLIQFSNIICFVMYPNINKNMLISLISYVTPVLMLCSYPDYDSIQIPNGSALFMLLQTWLTCYLWHI